MDRKFGLETAVLMSVSEAVAGGSGLQDFLPLAT